MGSRNFTAGLIIRIILLVAVIFSTGSTLILAFEKDLFFIPLMMFVLLTLQVLDFLYFVKRINRSLSTLLGILKNSDYTIKLKDEDPSPLKGVYRTFNEVSDYIAGLKLGNIAQQQYLQSVINHSSIGVISLKGDSSIEFINDYALILLGTNRPGNWMELQAKIPGFTSRVDEIQGKGSRLVEIRSKKHIKRLSVKVSSLVIMNEEYRIIAFQDIRSEIEQKEVEAWQKLIRILRHEIMNSVTPISSMTETTLMILQDHLGNARKASDVTDEDIHDIRDNIRTVHDRSEGLNEFLEQYREVTRIPSVKRESLLISQLIERSLKLLEPEMTAEEIHTSVKQLDPEARILADAVLIEQVLINLIRNSLEAMVHTSDKILEIRTESSAEVCVISVSDNGCGIPPGELDEIFVPFFSTKEKGSGIGLSLSRQIMNLHGGDILAESIPGEKTTFALVFYS
jgi:signal transduction histidine kinase